MVEIGENHLTLKDGSASHPPKNDWVFESYYDGRKWQEGKAPDTPQDLIQTAFSKKDSGKAPLAHLLYLPETVKEVSRVLEYGSRKYDKLNWRKCDDLDRYYSAALRHLISYYNGEQNDPETGLTHLAHAISNLMFVNEIEQSKMVE